MRSLFKNIFKIVKKVIESLIQLVEIMFFFNYNIKNYFSENPRKEALIIGNGPSFEREIKFFNDVKKKNNIEISCVNSFVLTTYFREIKPANYFLVHPYYFNIENYNFVKDLLNSLIINTKWDMNFYLPRYYLNSFFINKLLENSCIKLIPLNNIPMLGGFNGLKFFLFSHNLGNPVYQNVLIAAIFIAIQKKIKKSKSIQYLNEKLIDPVFYIFSNTSDDIQWIKEIYKFEIPVHYVGHDNPVYEDFRLMMNCKHFILSKSTSSWWVSYHQNIHIKISLLLPYGIMEYGIKMIFT